MVCCSSQYLVWFKWFIWLEDTNILNFEYSGTSVSQKVKSVKFEVLLLVFPVQLLGLVAVTPASEGWVSHSSLLLFCLKGESCKQA